MKKLKVAFDIDDTIWKIVETSSDGKTRQVPDYDLIQVLRWFYNNGDEVFVWSAGGLDYAQTIVDKLGLTDMVKVIPKNNYDGKIEIDIAFDDFDTKLAKVDIRVNRSEKKIDKNIMLCDDCKNEDNEEAVNMNCPNKLCDNHYRED